MQSEVALPRSAAPSPSLPRGCKGCKADPAEQGRMVPASDALAHCPGCAHRQELYCPRTPVPGALCLLPTESKGGEKQQIGRGQPFCMPGSLPHPWGQRQRR